jgi:RNA ligase (TIGR02306 family)
LLSSLIVQVREIAAIEPHPNADKLDIATVEGWQCIVGKGSFKPGDICVFIPPDSILPEKMVEEHGLEFLRSGGRVRPIKLRGFISQGLILPAPVGAKAGQDVAKAWGITKWEPDDSVTTQRQSDRKRGKNATQLRPNPNFHKYTDIENVRNFKTVLTDDEEVVITEKIHGTNFRAGWVPRHFKPGFIGWLQRRFLPSLEFVVGSRQVQLTAFTPKHARFYGEDVYGKTAKRLRLADILPKLPGGFVVYGEVYGKGVQDLTYGLDSIDVRLFDIEERGQYLSYDEFRTYCSVLGLETVPLLYRGPFSTEAMLQHTVGQSTLCPSQIREGCVVKPTTERFNGRVGRVILKSINPEYLVRKGGTEGH